MKPNANKFILILSLLVIVAGQSLRAQSSGDDAAMKSATAAFKALKYVSAIKQLSVIVRKDTGNLKAVEMLAYSYKMTNDYEGALDWYDKLIRQKGVKPEWALNYAQVLANVQQYERSEGFYRKYLSLVPEDKRAAAFSASNISNIRKNSGHWKLGFTNLNTSSADYAPAFYKDGLMFSSNRKTGTLSKRVWQWDNTPFTNLYAVAKLKDIKVVNPDSIIGAAKPGTMQKTRFNDDDTPPTSNDTRTLGQYTATVERDVLSAVGPKQEYTKLLPGLNTKYHDGAAASFPDGSVIFTRNNYYKGSAKKSKDGIMKLKLYIAEGATLGSITEFPYNSDEYSTGHPALSKDGTILVFASDMPGGYGGTDLYYSVRSGSGQFTRPVNLGKQINTEGNEMFPSLDKDGNLYFASNGLAGLGGLDIFEVALKEMRPVAAPHNMGAPINSQTDDFGLIMADDLKSGYLSSNRKGNDDIYRFNRVSYRIILEGVVRDSRTKLPIPNARILFRSLDGADTVRTNGKGEYRKDMPRETDYEMTTQKISYVSNMGFVSSEGIEQDSTIKRDILLSKAESKQQYVLNHCDSMKRVFAVQNIYYDLDRAEIRYDARPALDDLIDLMRKYPEITVNTSSHCDSRASESYNRDLSLRRGENAKAYLVARGISPSRVSVEYYGKTRLVNRCFDGMPCSEADQQLNRRTEFDVIINGVNITRTNCDDK